MNLSRALTAFPSLGLASVVRAPRVAAPCTPDRQGWRGLLAAALRVSFVGLRMLANCLIGASRNDPAPFGGATAGIEAEARQGRADRAAKGNARDPRGGSPSGPTARRGSGTGNAGNNAESRDEDLVDELERSGR